MAANGQNVIAALLKVHRRSRIERLTLGPAPLLFHLPDQKRLPEGPERQSAKGILTEHARITLESPDD